MKTRLARTAGFCMGVRRAMELALSAAHRGPEQAPVYTFGPLIHNPQVLELLETKGVGVLHQVPPPGSQKGGTVIIRAHGVPPEQKQALKAAGFSKVVDGTCPRVIRVQAIIQRAARAGADPVIVGDPEHPEVVGLVGHSLGRGHVVRRPEEVAGLPELKEVVVVAQTTQSQELFDQVVAALERRFGSVKVHQTICEATHSRQDEVLNLAREVQGMVVVGGRQSGNTRRLAQLASRHGPVFMVETEEELDRRELSRLELVGVTAGASTPNWMIKRVMRELGAIRSAREGRLAYWSRRVFRFLVRSQILVGLGGAGMTLAGSLLQGIAPSWRLAAVAFGYIFAMHVLNHFLDKEAGQYNDPDRAAFLTKHHRFLIGSGAAASLAALVLCLELGGIAFLAVALMSALGLAYSLPVLPRFLRRRLKIESLKDIPGSKTLSAALAWAVIAVILPPLSSPGPFPPPPLTAAAFLYVASLVLARCALFDLLDVQGDLIVGKETIPIVLGERRTRRLLVWLLGSSLVWLVLAALAGAPAGLCLLLVAPVAGLTLMKRLLTGKLILAGALGEGLVDLNFWLAGALSLLWWLW